MSDSCHHCGYLFRRIFYEAYELTPFGAYTDVKQICPYCYNSVKLRRKSHKHLGSAMEYVRVERAWWAEIKEKGHGGVVNENN